jgi:myo-inositol-1(or 4)-monophosphatase
MAPPSPDLAELAALALDTARAAAALAVRLRAAPLEIDTKSSGTDMVTNADRAVEALIVERLRDARPNDGVLGEEGAGGDHGSLDAEIVWIVDPIDGTTNFVYDHPGWAVSIAARLGGVEGDEVVGAVVVPGLGDEFVAVSGAGATCNGRSITIRSPPPLAEALVATGFGYDPARRARQAAGLTTVLPRIRDIRRVGAASVDLCSVGIGRVDAFYELGLKPWDLAAGGLVATEAGARVADLHGGRPGPDGVLVAAHPGLWDALSELLISAGL